MRYALSALSFLFFCTPIAAQESAPFASTVLLIERYRAQGGLVLRGNDQPDCFYTDVPIAYDDTRYHPTQYLRVYDAECHFDIQMRPRAYTHPEGMGRLAIVNESEANELLLPLLQSEGDE